MTTSELSTHKRHVTKRVQSPVGQLTLVATDDGLAAILWENDRPGRVRLSIAAEESGHPVLVDTERQLAEVLRGTADAVRAAPGLVRDGLSTAGVERALDDPIRRDAIVRADRGADRASRRRPRRRSGERQESPLDRGTVPSRRRRDGRAHGICRWPRRQGPTAGARVAIDPKRQGFATARWCPTLPRHESCNRLRE